MAREQGVGLGGESSSEAEITTGLGYSLGFVGPDASTPGFILPQGAECWQAAVLGTRIPSPMTSWADDLELPTLLLC